MPRRKLRIVPLSNTSDLSKGPIDLTTGFWIRDISGLLTTDTFHPFSARLSEEDQRDLLAWDLCLVHEFQSDLVLGSEETTSLYLMRFVVAALRWIRATQTTDTWFVQGFLTRGDSLTIPRYSTRMETITVPQFATRPQPIFVEDFEARVGPADPEVFRDVAPFIPRFQKIVADMILGKQSYVPVIIATRLAEQAYLEFDPQIRFLKRMMALEALFSTDATYGKKSLVPRVPKFIGASTPIYPRTGAPYTVGSTIEDILTLRNKFAHGDVVPTAFLTTAAHPDIVSTNVKSYADVLRECSALLVRDSLSKIFRAGLEETFSDKAKMEALF